MFCVNCGKQLALDFKFCPYCGTNVNAPVVQRVCAEDKYFDIRDGVLVKYSGRASTVRIPNTVKKIGKYAFSEERTGHRGQVEYIPNEYVTRIEVPDSVIEIAPWGFAYCTSLKEVILPSSLTTIEAYLFYGCDNLVDVQIPNSVKYIGSHAFGNHDVYPYKYCRELRATIPESVIEIAEDFCTSSWGENSYRTDVIFGGLIFSDSGSGHPLTKCKLNKKYTQIFDWVNSNKCRHCGGDFSYWNAICKKCGKKKDYTYVKKKN